MPGKGMPDAEVCVCAYTISRSAASTCLRPMARLSMPLRCFRRSSSPSSSLYFFAFFEMSLQPVNITFHTPFLSAATRIGLNSRCALFFIICRGERARCQRREAVLHTLSPHLLMATVVARRYYYDYAPVDAMSAISSATPVAEVYEEVRRRESSHEYGARWYRRAGEACAAEGVKWQCVVW